MNQNVNLYSNEVEWKFIIYPFTDFIPETIWNLTSQEI
jgi:hypothetical protein